MITLQSAKFPLAQTVSSQPSALPVQFGAKRQFDAPDTIEKSRFRNERIPLESNKLIEGLLARLDEAMTVAGETYAGNEAFTNVIELNIRPSAHAKNGAIDATVDTRVEHTANVGKAKNVGIMVLSSEATDYVTGQPIATARATFNAIDTTSVKGNLDQGKLAYLLDLLKGALTGNVPSAADLDQAMDAVRQPAAMRTVPVTPLKLDAVEQQVSDQAGAWNLGLSKFYQGVAARLQARDAKAVLPEAEVQGSSHRLVNNNVYVTPDMLNKKQTGHGGIAAANAVRDMMALSRKSAGGQPTVQRVTANYLAPFHPSDALQFDTTIDHVESNLVLDPDFEGSRHLQQTVYLSTRINKMDTKGRVVEGPIILVHAKLKLNASVPHGDNPENYSVPPVSPQDAEAQQRQVEALAWDKLG